MAGAAWVEMNRASREAAWSRFDSGFGFRPSTKPSLWPAIREPTPSVTLDLSTVYGQPDSAFVAGEAAVNAVALHAFTRLVEPGGHLLALDWQHPSYLFFPHNQAGLSEDWPVPVFPNGDYYIFLTDDMAAGCFGHPWEQTLCIFGRAFIELLAEPLAGWLPVLRRNGQSTI